jgi:transcriptional regulator NrdR family protein
MLTVKCPRCQHDQLCDPKLSEKTPSVVGKKKRCVYCGMTFSIHSNLEKTNIVQVGKRDEMNTPLF